MKNYSKQSLTFEMSRHYTINPASSFLHHSGINRIQFVSLMMSLFPRTVHGTNFFFVRYMNDVHDSHRMFITVDVEKKLGYDVMYCSVSAVVHRNVLRERN